MRPFRTQYREWLPAARCIFNRIVGEPNAGGLQLRFVRFLDQADSVTAFAYVDQDRFGRHPPASLADLATMFRDYQPHA